MQIVSLAVEHPCPFSRPVMELAHARVTHLCHRGKEALLELHAEEPAEFDRLLSEYRSLGGEVLYQEEDHPAALVRFAACACCRSGQVIPTLEGQGYLYLPPSLYSHTGESYQFLASEQRLDARLKERLPAEVAVLQAATKPLTSAAFEDEFLVPVGALLRELTDRQREAIVAAILRGYYRIPRTVKTEELARSFGISRPAFEALLRKAENKLVAELFPYLAVRGSVPASDAAEHPTAPPLPRNHRRRPDAPSK
jgi:predicted DNA binding protein